METAIQEEFRQRSKALRTSIAIKNKSHLKSTALRPGERIKNRPHLGVIVQEISLKRDGLLGLIDITNQGWEKFPRALK